MTLPVKRWFPAGLRDAPGAMCFVIERERERERFVVPGRKTGAVRIGVPCIRGIYRVHRMIIKYRVCTRGSERRRLRSIDPAWNETRTPDEIAMNREREREMRASERREGRVAEQRDGRGE